MATGNAQRPGAGLFSQYSLSHFSSIPSNPSRKGQEEALLCFPNVVPSFEAGTGKAELGLLLALGLTSSDHLEALAWAEGQQSVDIRVRRPCFGFLPC